MYQAQYWVELQNLKAHVYYLELYQIRSENIERGIGIVLAIASAGSIGGWAIWKEYAFVWGFFIMLSQVVSVVYKFLPFKARIKPLSAAGIELSVLADDAEKGWFDVAQGELTEREINEKRFAIRKKKSAVMKSAFAGMVIPEKAGLMTKAESQMRRYFQSHYPELTNE
ncbi:hypothetical protein [Pseudomonas chlororaphis]|uniref:hypothetical protein n=1 Tax=Pseudomonas chlororaphis TaxID=587753 RepID=UPI0005F951D3|nr:hypothetical protein [Pseudomonas chlororaphis]MBP5065478.1 hypothetical protein [Pseudomonas chlororaphis]QTT93876.1 hypothetical protein HUT27_10470 [Pseudomonas chlororaphis]